MTKDVNLSDIPLKVWIIIGILFIIGMSIVGFLLSISGFNMWTGLDVGYCDIGCVLGKG